jgi:hypothetical protein
MVRDLTEVGSFGKILPQESIGLFVGSPLPRGVRMGEEHVDAQPLGDPLVLGEFLPVVER